MIGEHVKYICKDLPDLIENYDKAIDSDEVWDCHHKLETHTSDGQKRPVQLTIKELKALDMYYQRPANELIFLTKSEHRGLHNLGNSWCKGKKRPHSEEAKRKMSLAKKGKRPSEETKRKMSLALKGNSNRPKRIIICLETQEEHCVSEWKRLGYHAECMSSKGLHFKYKD